MRIFSQDLFLAMLNSGSQRVTVTINPYLIDQVDKSLPDQTAAVTLSADGEETVTGTGPQTITVNAGVNVTYSVTKSTYSAIQNQIITPYSNITKNVTLSNVPTKTVTINTTPSDADVKITCVETSAVTNAKTAQIEIGYHYNVEVTKVGLTKTTASFICSAETEENTHDIVMNATISWGSIIPNDATKTMSRTYDYQNPVIDEASMVVPCTAQIVYWKIEKPGYTTASGTVEQASGFNYIVDTVIPNQVLPLAQLHYTVNVVSPVDAEVHATVYNPNNDTTTTIDGVGTTVIDCKMGDVVSYTVSKQYYNSVSNSTTMGSTDLSSSVTLTASVNYVTIYANPSAATISLSINGEAPITAVGELNYPVPVGSTITYSASYGGETSTSRTATINYSSPNYYDTIAIDAIDEEVDLITTSVTKVLEPGRYYFICIGGGASGKNSTDSHQQMVKMGRSFYFYDIYGAGGVGGSSGYITYGSFVLEESTQIEFTVGAGGKVANINSGSPSVDGTASIIKKVSDDSILGQADGGTSTAGGSGSGAPAGAAGGAGIVTTTGTYYSVSTNGYKGALGGGNGEPRIGEIAPFSRDGGTGFYNETKTYANNAGTKGSPGTSGGGGVGVSALSSMITVTFLRNMNATALQTLYNSIGGGGSGGSSTTYDTGSIAGNGGAGGGGGGWTAGKDGAVDSERTTRRALGGDGGDGAILIARYGWE